jgi:hypothetical protein
MASLLKKPEKGHAADGEPADLEHPRGPRQLLAEAAHLGDVARAAHGVHDRTGAQEQSRLEEGVREKVEDAAGEIAGAHAHEHETELADRGIGQHLLEVVLGEADDGGEQRRQRADHGDDGQRRRASM